jgi:hypothetical protein
MKITKRQLKQIIKEELTKTLHEDHQVAPGEARPPMVGGGEKFVELGISSYPGDIDRDDSARDALNSIVHRFLMARLTPIRQAGWKYGGPAADPLTYGFTDMGGGIEAFHQLLDGSLNREFNELLQLDETWSRINRSASNSSFQGVPPEAKTAKLVHTHGG